MKNKYALAGSILTVLGIGFLAVALTNPQLSFPWPNWVSYTFYALYAGYTILIFCMPRMKNTGLFVCVILALDFIALGLFVLSIGVKTQAGESNWYLPAGLMLINLANLANLYYVNKKKKTEEKENI